MAEQDSDSASKAATKVQEAAANVRQARSRAQAHHQEQPPSRSRGATSRRSTRATSTRQSALWAEGGRDNVRGQIDVLAPEGVRAFLGELLDAIPDLQLRDRLDDHAGRALRRAVPHQRHVRRAWNAQRHTAHRRSLRDRGHRPADRPDGLIQSNDAFPDSISLPRQLGMIPPQGSLAEQRLTGAFNAKTRLSARLSAGEAQLVADGRVGRAGPAGPLQRVPDRGRRRRDDVRRGRDAR